MPTMPMPTDDDTDDNTTRRTEHDCIGSLPMSQKAAINSFFFCSGEVHATFQLFNLPLSDVIDEDMQRYNRQ